MNAQEWNKLRKNWTRLLEVYPSCVTNSLYEMDTISSNDKKKVEKGETPSEKMERLLSILKSKPSDMKAFDALMTALEKEDRCGKELADDIRATETDCDASLKSEVDPHIIDKEVRIVLHKNFVNKSKSLIKLSEIREVLIKNGVFKKIEWKNEVLIDFVRKEFVEVELKVKSQGIGKTVKKETFFKNIAKVNQTQKKVATEKEQQNDAIPQLKPGDQECTDVKGILNKEDQSAQDIEKLQSKVEEIKLVEPTNNLQPTMEEMSSDMPIEYFHPKMEEMSSKQLMDYLRPKMEKLQFQTDILSDLLNENVTGSVFLTMTENDFKENFPSATFGIRRFLSGQINDNSHPPPVKTYTEYLRKFNKEVQHTDKYIRGRCIDANINVRGRKTDPVRNFHPIRDQDQFETVEFIASEVVCFASACLNDRHDGTIYFGINPQNDEHSKPGEIVGVSVSKEDIESEIREYLHKSFEKNQQNLISGTVRDAKFVPVVSDVTKNQELNLWVVEVDVVPSSFVLKDEKVRTKLKVLPNYAKNRRRKDTVMFRFSSDGIPEIIPSDELYDYEKDQERIVHQRQEEEAAAKRNAHSSPDLRSKLLGLLTGGTEVLQDTIFPFLMTSSIDMHMDEDYLSRNMTFIKGLSPEIVFDFDPTGSNKGIYNMLDTVGNEVMRALTTENFDKEHPNKEKYTIFTQGLANESRTSWVFCNGYDVLNMDPMEPTEWNRKRRNAFQESLRLYKDNFDKDRIIVIILLFSKKYEVMIEACEEVLTKLPDNWMLLAESEDTAKLWQSQILARNKAEKQEVADRCVIGMPWELVDLTIQRAVSKSDSQNEFFLPTSTGAFVDVREKKLKDWCDIDVLSAGDFIINENEREKKMKEVEEQFYRGEQVSWLNFYFHNQVLKRDIHDELMRKVTDALEGKSKEEEDKVTSVSILHQPGAGGTTTAKQVLWDLRKIYRCCIVNIITDQTCDQLDEIRTYKDSNPKPLLILLDNEDEDKILQIVGNLEERGRKSSRASDKDFNVYCTIISCIHRASLPKQIKRNQISLRQELVPIELDWFKEKNDSLESRFNKDKERNVNPKFLISFNILRENFNKKYISKVVKEFSDDVKNAKEVKLLKIISLLNTYDLDFKPVQVSCLDKILEDEQIIRTRKSQGLIRREMKWEANLSQGVRVLLNLSSDKNRPGRARSSLRVFNKNIAQEILTRMKERTGQKESEMMLELLESGIFELESLDSKKLQTIINNVVKKREFKDDGIRKTKFSQFVTHVETTEGKEVAVGILEHLFELNQDPFTAQLISRYYIDMKNWNKAEHFAKRATSMLPTNSFLWDTFGQVYKNQLVDKISPEGFKDEDIHSLIELSEKCIYAFRKEQKVSEDETTTSGENNFAGYFGELRVIVLILSALKICPSFRHGDTLHKFLIDEHFQPSHLGFLSSEEIGYLKHLKNSSTEAMRRLDDEYLQIKASSHLMNVVSVSSDNDKRTLLFLKVNLDEYFGEASDFLPQNLGELGKGDYIRRRVYSLGAKSLHNLLILRQNNQIDVINKIYLLLTKEIKPSSYVFDDFRTLLDTATVLMIDNRIPKDLKFEQVLVWCRKLYEMKEPKDTNRCYLETFLYFVMYNFPTEERQIFSLCFISDLISTIEKWQNAFMEKYPKTSKEGIKLKRETTLFFLGNGPPLYDIVHHDALSEMEQYSRTVKWDVPELRKKLRMMSGSLCDQGKKVNITITTKEGNKHTCFIQTSHRVTNKDMWQKKVYFYLGFSFSGPRAYGMSPDELGITQGTVPQGAVSKIQSQTFVPSSKIKQENYPILSTLIQELAKIRAQIKKEPKKKLELEKRIQKINNDINKLVGE